MHGYVPPVSEINRAAAKAVDDYLLMERKARAWDVLYADAVERGTEHAMDKLLANAGAPATLTPSTNRSER
jgi:hypothetical protein